MILKVINYFKILIFVKNIYTNILYLYKKEKKLKKMQEKKGKTDFSIIIYSEGAKKVIRKEGDFVEVLTYDKIINNKNLIFNLQFDWTFKNVFLNEISLNFLCHFLNYLLGYDYKDLKDNLRIVNGEIPTNVIGHNNGHSDIILKYKNTYIILEMNGSNKQKHIDKNYWYLFLEHSSRLSNKNNYTQDIKTILINIDNYDVIGKNKFIYDSRLLFDKYRISVYNSIRILHINLDYLRKKHYTDSKLNQFEKSMLIFVEQDRRKIENKTKRKDVIDIMNFMETLKFKPGDAVTYDRDAFLKSCEEDVKQRLEEANEKFNKANEKLENAEIEANKRLENAELEEEKIKQSRMELEEEKISLAKALKAEGYPTNKITKITKLSKNMIMML